MGLDSLDMSVDIIQGCNKSGVLLDLEFKSPYLGDVEFAAGALGVRVDSWDVCAASPAEARELGVSLDYTYNKYVNLLYSTVEGALPDILVINSMEYVISPLLEPVIQDMVNVLRFEGILAFTSNCQIDFKALEALGFRESIEDNVSFFSSSVTHKKSVIS